MSEQATHEIIDGVSVPLSPSRAAEIGAAWAAAEAARNSKDARKEVLAGIRYAKEVGGITVGGAPIPTDRETQAKLIGARTLAKEDAGYAVTWKTPAGFLPLDAATIIAVANAVAAHVKACFDREAELSAEIDAAADRAALDAIDLNAGWPGA